MTSTMTMNYGTNTLPLDIPTSPSILMRFTKSGGVRSTKVITTLSPPRATAAPPPSPVSLPPRNFQQGHKRMPAQLDSDSDGNFDEPVSVKRARISSVADSPFLAFNVNGVKRWSLAVQAEVYDAAVFGDIVQSKLACLVTTTSTLCDDVVVILMRHERLMHADTDTLRLNFRRTILMCRPSIEARPSELLVTAGSREVMLVFFDCNLYGVVQSSYAAIGAKLDPHRKPKMYARVALLDEPARETQSYKLSAETSLKLSFKLVNAKVYEEPTY